jgi:hypothetical protein
MKSYPSKVPAIGPLPRLLESYQDNDNASSRSSGSFVNADDHSLVYSELSSFLDEKAGISPFVPYRINDKNMRQLENIFGGVTELRKDPVIDKFDFARQNRLDSVDSLSFSSDSWDSLTPRSIEFRRDSISSLGSVSLIRDTKNTFESLYTSPKKNNDTERDRDISNASFYARAKTAEKPRRLSRKDPRVVSRASKNRTDSHDLHQGSFSSWSSTSDHSHGFLPEMSKTTLNPMAPRGLFVGSIGSMSAVSLANSREDPDVPDSLAHLDPLNLSVNIGERKRTIFFLSRNNYFTFLVSLSLRPSKYSGRFSGRGGRRSRI